MLRVGLTGGIACGKTVVRRLLADRGAFTIDADAIVHQLMGAGTDLTRRIADAFGPDVLSPEEAVDRTKLGRLVFSDPSERSKLNALVHPEVIREEKRLLREAEGKGVDVAVVDAALMIEAGTYRDYDRLLVVHCPRALQLDRLAARDGLSRTEAARRVDAQMPVDEKKPYADFLIDTSGSLADTERQVQAVWEKLRNDANP
ncbi:MAG TPA: dephospho-CoA kinase [Vicinamibacteria bacterium]|jgi:dephospho-CoA kinase